MDDTTKLPNPSWDLDHHQGSMENPNYNDNNILERQVLLWRRPDLQTIIPPGPGPAATSRLVIPDEEEAEAEEEEELGALKEMMYKIAAMQPVDIDPASIRKPKRRNVRISEEPQSVAARHRRERISEKIRILQRLVPGGTKMDTASMLEEAIRYVKFLKRQIRLLQPNNNAHAHVVALAPTTTASLSPPAPGFGFGGGGDNNNPPFTFSHNE